MIIALAALALFYAVASLIPITIRDFHLGGLRCERWDGQGMGRGRRGRVRPRHILRAGQADQGAPGPMNTGLARAYRKRPQVPLRSKVAQVPLDPGRSITVGAER
jgi:hypothetical protein